MRCALRFAYIFSKLLRKMIVRPFKYKSTYVAYSYYCFTFILFLHFSLCFSFYSLYFFFTLYSYGFGCMRIRFFRIFIQYFKKLIIITVYFMYKRCRHLKYELSVFLFIFLFSSLTLSLSLRFIFIFLYLVLRLCVWCFFRWFIRSFNVCGAEKCIN